MVTSCELVAEHEPDVVNVILYDPSAVVDKSISPVLASTKFNPVEAVKVPATDVVGTGLAPFEQNVLLE